MVFYKHFIFFLLFLCSSFCLPDAKAGGTFLVEAEDFQFPGDWTISKSKKGFSGKAFLYGGADGAEAPAAVAVEPKTEEPVAKVEMPKVEAVVKKEEPKPEPVKKEAPKAAAPSFFFEEKQNPLEP